MNKIDRAGQRYGHWTVIERVSEPGQINVRWLCRCDCGKEKKVYWSNLSRGLSTNCGCQKGRFKPKDIRGLRVGNLVVLEHVGTQVKSPHSALWLCQCDCGNQVTLPSGKLKPGKLRSCGCVKYAGENHHAWRGGRRLDRASGCVFVLNPDYPLQSDKRYIQESHLVMQQHLGRILSPRTYIIHKNGNAADNRLENLFLLESTDRDVLTVGEA